MNAYREGTTSFVESARGVSSAAALFKTAISGGDPSDIEFATDILLRAADSYTGNTTHYERSRFDGLAAIPAEKLPQRERVASDLLAGALIDIEIANTLFVSEQVVRGVPGGPEIAKFDQVTDRLTSLINAVALPLGRPSDIPIGTNRFRFDDAVPTPYEAEASPDLATAKVNFETRFQGVLAALVTGSKHTLEHTYSEIKELDANKIAEAINAIVQTVEDLPGIGKLISKGLALIVSALKKLTDILGRDNISLLGEKAKEIIGHFTGGQALVDRFLADSYGVVETTKHVKSLLSTTSSEVTKIDAGSKRLIQLQNQFAEQMALANRIVDALNAANKYIFPALMLNINVVPLVAASYLVLMGYTLLAGMDFADTGTLFRFVAGVITISEETLA